MSMMMRMIMIEFTCYAAIKVYLSCSDWGIMPSPRNCNLWVLNIGWWQILFSYSLSAIFRSSKNLPNKRATYVMLLLLLHWLIIKGCYLKWKDQKLIHKGLITESPPNNMFRVDLDNEDLVSAYILKRMWRGFIRIL